MRPSNSLCRKPGIVNLAAFGSTYIRELVANLTGVSNLSMQELLCMTKRTDWKEAYAAYFFLLLHACAVLHTYAHTKRACLLGSTSER